MIAECVKSNKSLWRTWGEKIPKGYFDLNGTEQSYQPNERFWNIQKYILLDFCNATYRGKRITE